MMKRSIWLLVAMLIATAVFAFAACRKDPEYQLSETEITLTVGESKQLSIAPVPEEEVVWSSSNESVATVENGTVTAHAAGSAAVSATVGGVDYKLSCAVNVREAGVADNGYRLDFARLALKTGESKQIRVLNEEGDYVSSVTYSSANDAVATVSADGTVTAAGNGETNIIAKADGAELICHVVVAQKYTYSLDKTALDIAAGGTDRIALIVTPGGGENSRPHTFSSSDTDVVTVNGGSGKVTGVAKGTATISCLVDGEELTATVTVTEYTVKIDGEALVAETSLRLGKAADITVTADPDREVSAVFRSENEEVAIIKDGQLVPVAEGKTAVTVTVGGREFRTTVTVLPAVVWSINHEKAAVDLGQTLQLEVTRDPEAEFKVTFESSDDTVASVDANGLVTAHKIGNATITAAVTGTDVRFETAVSVVMHSELMHEDYGAGSDAANITRLDANKTIDWHLYNNHGNNANTPTKMKDGAGVIDVFETKSVVETFSDYKTPVLFEDAKENKSGASTQGRAVQGSYTVSVKLTNTVSKVVIFTGSWKETATIEFKIGDVVLQSEEFVGGESALARKYVFTVDTSVLKADEDLTLTVAVNLNRSQGGNVSLVGVAVIGKTAHEARSVTASTAAQTQTGITSAQNLTEAGTMDWVAASRENDTKKAGVPKDEMIKESKIGYAPNSGTATDYKASVSWTDGTKAAGSSTFFYHADVSITIPVQLEKGKTTVTLFATGWNCSYALLVRDVNRNIVNAHQGAYKNGGNSVASRIAVTVNAEQAGEYSFVLMKSAGEGNIGWAAVAVSGANDFEPEKAVYNLALGAEAEIVLKGTGTAPSVSYVSEDSTVAEVDANGNVTAKKIGNTVITATYGGLIRKIYVTVTEYTLTSDSDITLPFRGSSQIEISANPDSPFDVTYESQNEGIATVNKKGLIQAVADGTTTVTATVNGKTFTITVTVDAYSLNHNEITLKVDSNETETLAVLDPENQTVSGVTFESDDPAIAAVDEAGVVTAVGVGKTTVTASVNGKTFSCTVNVLIPDTTAQLVELDMGFENLSRVSSQYKTIDYKHWSNENTVEMNGREALIDEPSFTAGNFWDYKTTIGYEFAVGGRNLGKTYGKTSRGFELPVKISNLVSEIVFYTGAYDGTATISFKIGERVLGTVSFTAADSGIARKVVLPIDTSKMAAGLVDTLIIKGEFSGGGNVNVVAAAVIGKVEYSGNEIAAGTGTATAARVEGEKGSNKVNLTEVGTYDWIYSHYENPKEPTYRKFNGNDVFKGETYYDHEGNATGGAAQWDGYSAFSWTDGIRSDLIGTEGAAAGNNPVDNDISGGGDYTNNYFAAKGEIHVAMKLVAGKYQITAYLNSYQSPLAAAIYDGNNNFVVGKSMINADLADNESQGWVVTFTLDVSAESEFKLVVGKCRSHGEQKRQVGWQAIAVAQITE